MEGGAEEEEGVGGGGLVEREAEAGCGRIAQEGAQVFTQSGNDWKRLHEIPAAVGFIPV